MYFYKKLNYKMVFFDSTLDIFFVNQSHADKNLAYIDIYLTNGKVPTFRFRL